MEMTKGKITFEQDDFTDAPWSRSDCHGPVRTSNNAHNAYRSDKKPGERPLNCASGNEYQYYYDLQKATKMAITDWGVKTKAEAMEMVQQDFDYLRAWINSDWHYVFVTVTYEGETDTMGGVETWKDYHVAFANEMLADLIAWVDAQKLKENTEREYWNCRDVCTIGA